MSKFSGLKLILTATAVLGLLTIGLEAQAKVKRAKFHEVGNSRLVFLTGNDNPGYDFDDKILTPTKPIAKAARIRGDIRSFHRVEDTKFFYTSK